MSFTTFGKLNYSGLHIAVAPLDWGIGHASRCVPLIRVLLHLGCRVTLVAENRPAAFLAKEFPTLDIVPCLSYGILYPEKGSLSLSLFRQALRKKRLIKEEHQLFCRLAEKHQFDGVISDNRFGCHIEGKPSVILTHQVNVAVPVLLRSVVNKLNKNMLNRFDEVWIVDYETAPGLAGDLSHPLKGLKNYRYIGALTRLEDNGIGIEKKFEWMGLISGPENQRTVFEHILEKNFSGLDSPTVIIRGITEGGVDISRVKGNITYYDHVSAPNLVALLKASEKIVCRSGYSTLMDLEAIGKRAVLVPTPGQSEQEYLAKANEKSGRHYFVEQEKLDISKLFNAKGGGAESLNKPEDLPLLLSSWLNSF